MAYPFGCQAFQVLINTQFVNGAQCFHRDFQRHPFASLGNEEALRLQVGQKAAARFPVGVGDVVSADGAFAR